MADAPAGESTTIRVAVADVSATVARGSALDRHAPHQHHVGVHAAPELPDAARPIEHRPDVAQSRRGSARGGGGDRGRRRRRVPGVEGLPRRRAQPREARLPCGRRVAAGRRPTASGARGRSRAGGEPEAPGRRGATPEGAPPRPRSPRAGDHRGASGVRGRHREPARGREAEPRQEPDRGLHDRGQRDHRALPRSAGIPRLAPRGALARALAADRRARRRVRRPATGRARRPCPERLPAEAARGRSAPLSRSLADDHQAARTRRVRGELSRAGGRRTLRPRGERVHALDRPEPALSGSRHPAPRPRGARRASRFRTPRTSSVRSPRNARSRRTARRRSSGWCGRLRPRVS